MALVYKVHIQGGNDNIAPFPHNHPYISSWMLRLGKIATYVGIVVWEWCCVIITYKFCCVTIVQQS